MVEPPLGAVLRPVQLPKSGGDTCFANCPFRTNVIT